MNLRSYDKSTRFLKSTELATNGNYLEGANNVLLVGVLDTATNCNPRLKENLTAGIRQEKGVALHFNLTNFDYLKRITPATAKYARSYINSVAKNTEAIVRANMLDSIVAIVDNNIMALGVLEGCTRLNCPVILMPVGINPDYDETLLLTPGKIAIREIKAGDADEIANTFAPQNGISPDDTLTTALFSFAEDLGLMLPGASDLKANTGATFAFATQTGMEAVTRADNIITTKRLINKKTLTEALDSYHQDGLSACGVLQCSPLLALIELKLPTNIFPSLKGLTDTAYVVSDATAPLTMQGQVWAYRSLTDAMNALTSNAIDNGIIVLQNCLDCDVSIIAKTIVAMQKENEIAILTDGYCVSTNVLTIANITPSSFDNQDFANLQTGDMVEIDVTKGRLMANVSSKDMKLRAKRNIVKKYEIYF